MINKFLLYLAEASIGIFFVALIYRLFLHKLTFFAWNRYYLLSGIILSVLLPVTPIPTSFLNITEKSAASAGVLYTQNIPLNFDIKTWTVPALETETNDTAFLLSLFLLSIYFAGVLFKSGKLLADLNAILRVKRKAVRIQSGDFYSVYMQSELPTCSFGNHIFLHTETLHLNQWETDQVLLHEKTHITLKHSYDLILIEVARIVFWFNPCIGYIAKTIRKIHEYQVDAQVTSVQRNAGDYGRLLVKLASGQSQMAMIHTFSDSQIFDRITMLTKTKSKAMQKLKFLSILPVTALVVLLCSCFEINSSELNRSASVPATQPLNANNRTIGTITWIGNTQHTADELNKILQFYPGDPYDSTLFDNRLNFLPDSKDVTSYYMDQGYLFFRIEKREKFRDDKVDLTLNVYEGQKARIGKVLLKGNKTVSSGKILDLIDVRPGDPFSRSKLISSQKKLADMGAFDSKSIEINPIPDHESFAKAQEGNVDIEFTMSEL